jgi:hypothetical protein
MLAIMLDVTHKSQLSQQKLVGSLKRICGYLGVNWEEWASTTTLSWLQTVTICLCLVVKQVFREKILSMADVGPSGAEAIALFEDVHILTPRYTCFSLDLI